MKDIPKKYRLLVGQSLEMRGGLFSGKKAITPTTFDVQGIRWSDAQIWDMKKHKAKHPAFELLVINGSMKRARWTRPFPIREIRL